MHKLFKSVKFDRFVSLFIINFFNFLFFNNDKKSQSDAKLDVSAKNSLAFIQQQIKL
jgi:hypothetical protein